MGFVSKKGGDIMSCCSSRKKKWRTRLNVISRIHTTRTDHARTAIHRAAFATKLGALAFLIAMPIVVLNQARAADVAPGPTRAAPAPEPLAEIEVTGSRIVREGYASPTPLTVVGAEQLESIAAVTLVERLDEMPALTGSTTAVSAKNSLSNGVAGVQTLNLRSLGADRVLVLLDGERTVGATYKQELIDVASFPQQLISRVDVVTGGASAVYGSDAVAGVVNFVLDKNFTGFKSEVSGGMTSFGDGGNFKIDLTGGFGFAGGRGHVLLSGEYLQDNGIQGDGGRAWDRTGWQQVPNPAYKPGNGQPNLLFTNQVGFSIASPGGLVIAGPLRGTYFGAGGIPGQLQYGAVAGIYMIGGQWQYTDERSNADLAPRNTSDNLFGRVSYELTDHINAYVGYAFSQNHLKNSIEPTFALGSVTVRNDNAYLPATTKAAMAAAGITSLTLGTLNNDQPHFGNDNKRDTSRINAGLSGDFDVFATTWRWKTHYSYGVTDLNVFNPASVIAARYAQAVDAVVNPATSAVVCRSTLTNPNNGCLPWNTLGTGVNGSNQAAFNWFNNNSDFQRGHIIEQNIAASITGEPFSIWAGPVSIALDAEHRDDSVYATVCPLCGATNLLIGNFAGIEASEKVNEVAAETVVPLAKDLIWAKAWDFTAAVRYTSYQVSGKATTFKLGTEYSPIPDVKLRLTRSRDIRAPDLFELFSPSQSGVGGTVIDRFLGNTVYSPNFTTTAGNTALRPEVAYTTGIGVVLQPTFWKAFSMSVDYWDVSIKESIQNTTAQQIVDECFYKLNTSICPNITRSPTTGLITNILVAPINAAVQDVRGVDLEASYHQSMSDWVSNWRGGLSVHALVTRYLRNYLNNNYTPPSNEVGVNNDVNPPLWKGSLATVYDLDPLTVGLTVRVVSAGLIDSTFIQCTSNCPPVTAAHPTINYNHIPGAVYLDANTSYKFLNHDKMLGEVFFTVRNILNKDPPPTVSVFYTNLSSQATLYDILGTEFRLGVRFKM
jgi:iron complex outermembrane receptor protein